MERKINDGDIEFICDAYDNNKASMIELAERYHVSRQYVWKVLKANGIDTRKRKLKSVCYWCDKEFYRGRKYLRRSKRSFCSFDCYMDWLRELGADYDKYRHRSRLGRGTVSQYFDLRPHQVVHHINKDGFDNRPDNLMVFANNGEHTRFHRGFDVKPIWDGSRLRYNSTKLT